MEFEPTTEEKDAANRRQFARVSTQLSMQYRVIREDGVSRAWNSTYTKNISASGICFESFHPLSMNMLLEINVSIPFFKSPIALKARVIRAAEIKPGEIYGVAAAIVDISAPDRKKLQVEIEQVDISSLLHLSVMEGATDLHLSLGLPPVMRKAGVLVPMDAKPLQKMALKRMIFSLLKEDQINSFLHELELTTTVTVVTIDGEHRFRLNVFFQQGVIEAVFHSIRMPVPGIDELNLPPVVRTFARKKSGLVIFTGPGGCGKTTTCASVVNFITITTDSVIMTFQRCIEYIFYPAKSIIRHREFGLDTHSLASALDQSAFQDPDVLVIGDLPDEKTMECALDAAQSGKLVLITFSSAGVITALQKIVNLFPAEKQYYARRTLSQCLVGVIFQKFLPGKLVEKPQVTAAEVLVNSPEVGDSIREGLLDKIPSIIQNDSRYGMRSLLKSVKELYGNGQISKETAEQYSS